MENKNIIPQDILVDDDNKEVIEDFNRFKSSLQDSLNETPPTVLDKVNTASEEDISNLESKTILKTYNSDTGMSSYIEIDIDKLADHQMDLLNSTDSDEEVNMSALGDLLASKDIEEFSDVVAIAALVQRRVHGEQFNPYNDLPQSLKNVVDNQMVTNGLPINTKHRSMISNMILNDIVEEYKKSSDGMDIDMMLSSLQESTRKMTDGISKDIGTMLMSMDKDRNETFDNAIAKAEADGKIEAANKIRAIKDSIDSAFNLDDFAEYCKTVRIKKFDLEKPQRIFDTFNQKYINHKYNIGDISNCPLILDLHIRDSHTDNLKYCIAFCKYCMNKNPDNIADHTFMYYFIRNISMIERLNPRGAVYDTMSSEEKDFYDKYIEKIKLCINNINNR